MARYIDADKLLEWAIEFYPIDTQFQSAIKNAPTADVAPVKHGKWEATEYKGTVGGEFREKICSCCKEYTYIDVDDIYNFCPYCGADMRGVAK